MRGAIPGRGPACRAGVMNMPKLRGSRCQRAAVSDVTQLNGVKNESRIPWFERNEDLFVNVKERGGIEQFVQQQGGKYKVVDFYAGWCSSCKSAYPKLCQIASDPELVAAYDFVKCNIDEDDVKTLMRKEGVRGIPYMVVYDEQGLKVGSFLASFKKMDIVRKNLKYILEHKGSNLCLDPNGFLTVLK